MQHTPTLLLSATLLFVGCSASNNSGSGPEATLAAYIEALESNDPAVLELIWFTEWDSLDETELAESRVDFQTHLDQLYLLTSVEEYEIIEIDEITADRFDYLVHMLFRDDRGNGHSTQLLIQLIDREGRWRVLLAPSPTEFLERR